VDILLPFALILVAFYLLIIRPQRNRARAAAQLQARLAPGAQVITTAGLYGTVTEVADDAVHLEVAPGVTMRFAKAAVGRILPEDTSDAADDTDETTGTTGTALPTEGSVEGDTDADAGSRRSTGD
jgi:preprotein translocase subunit YajC